MRVLSQFVCAHKSQCSYSKRDAKKASEDRVCAEGRRQSVLELRRELPCVLFLELACVELASNSQPFLSSSSSPSSHFLFTHGQRCIESLLGTCLRWPQGRQRQKSVLFAALASFCFLLTPSMSAFEQSVGSLSVARSYATAKPGMHSPPTIIC